MTYSFAAEQLLTDTLTAVADDVIATSPPREASQALNSRAIRSHRGSTKKRTRKSSPHDLHVAFTRAQQDSKLYNLKLDINDLKQQLHELAVRRELLDARAFVPRRNSDVSVLQTVGRYFHGFEPGYRGRHEHPEQNAFVRSIVDEDFSLGVTGLGVDMLLEQWRRYTELFHVRNTVLHAAEIITSIADNNQHEPSFVVAKCTMDFRGVLTRTAVDLIFPAAQRDPELLLQALGREIAIPMLFHLFFNDDGRLVRHDAVADFFGAVREALGGDVATAVRFISDAHVGQESMLGTVPEPVRDPDEPVCVASKRMRSDLVQLADEEPMDDLDMWVHHDDNRLPRAVVSPSIDDDLSDEPDEENRHDATAAASTTPDVGKTLDADDADDADGRLSLTFLLSAA